MCHLLFAGRAEFDSVSGAAVQAGGKEPDGRTTEREGAPRGGEYGTEASHPAGETQGGERVC